MMLINQLKKQPPSLPEQNHNQEKNNQDPMKREALDYLAKPNQLTSINPPNTIPSLQLQI